MLSAYLERCYPLADGEEQAAFEQLLTMQDPVLHALLINPIQSRETDTDRLIEKIRDAVKA